MSIRTEVSETRTCTWALCHVVQPFFQFFYSYFEKLSRARQPNQSLGEGTKTQPLKAVRFFSLPRNGIWLLERLIPPTTLLIDLEQARKGCLIDDFQIFAPIRKSLNANAKPVLQANEFSDAYVRSAGTNFLPKNFRRDKERTSKSICGAFGIAPVCDFEHHVAQFVS